MAAALVIAISTGIHTDSGATGTAAGPLVPQSRQARESTASPRVAPEKCPGLKRAVKFYAGRIAYWRSKTGAGTPVSERAWKPNACPRYLAHVLQRKAYAAHSAYERWHRFHYEWTSWLPDKWQRVGACETGYGRRPGSWTWDSGTYVSAFGIYRAGYSQFAHEIGQLSWDETRSRLGRYPTPREQYNVALRIYYHYGFSGWGCRNA